MASAGIPEYEGRAACDLPHGKALIAAAFAAPETCPRRLRAAIGAEMTLQLLLRFARLNAAAKLGKIG